MCAHGDSGEGRGRERVRGERERERNREIFFFSFLIRHKFPHDDPTLKSSFKPKDLPKLLSPNTTTFGAGASTDTF